ncbi:hypothetical protein CAI21_09510 [Alkalilimnicola ehrlichii]|nr:hypothetical protein CAI21_09510 [Alkalilimnicola ehrlichii]
MGCVFVFFGKSIVCFRRQAYFYAIFMVICLLLGCIFFGLCLLCKFVFFLAFVCFFGFVDFHMPLMR